MDRVRFVAGLAWRSASARSRSAARARRDGARRVDRDGACGDRLRRARDGRSQRRRASSSTSPAEAEVRAFVMAEPSRLVVDHDPGRLRARPGGARRRRRPCDGLSLRASRPGPFTHRGGLGIPRPHRLAGRSRRPSTGGALCWCCRSRPSTSWLNHVSDGAVPAGPQGGRDRRRRIVPESPIALPGASASPSDGPIVDRPRSRPRRYRQRCDKSVRRAGEIARPRLRTRSSGGHRVTTRSFEVLLTRDDDSFLPLGERVAFAREKGARLFVSIHADAVRESYVRGATVYTLSERASDAHGRRPWPTRRTASTCSPGSRWRTRISEVADILIDLARRETKNFSILAARTLVGQLKRRDASSTRIRSAPRRFKVLRAPDVPSVLLELGYLSNPDDADRVRGRGVARRRPRSVIATAVRAYFGDGRSDEGFSGRSALTSYFAHKRGGICGGTGSDAHGARVGYGAAPREPSEMRPCDMAGASVGTAAVVVGAGAPGSIESRVRSMSGVEGSGL